MNLPRAAELQGGSNDIDLSLVALARRRRPHVRWWWGRRNWQEPGYTIDQVIADDTHGQPAGRIPRNGAWCYLCDKAITSWSSSWPITEQAKAAIAAHRSEHIQRRLDTPAARNGEER